MKKIIFISLFLIGIFLVGCKGPLAGKAMDMVNVGEVELDIEMGDIKIIEAEGDEGDPCKVVDIVVEGEKMTILSPQCKGPCLEDGQAPSKLSGDENSAQIVGAVGDALGGDAGGYLVCDHNKRCDEVEKLLDDKFPSSSGGQGDSIELVDNINRFAKDGYMQGGSVLKKPGAIVYNHIRAAEMSLERLKKILDGTTRDIVANVMPDLAIKKELDLLKNQMGLINKALEEDIKNCAPGDRKCDAAAERYIAGRLREIEQFIPAVARVRTTKSKLKVARQSVLKDFDWWIRKDENKQDAPDPRKIDKDCLSPGKDDPRVRPGEGDSPDICDLNCPPEEKAVGHACKENQAEVMQNDPRYLCVGSTTTSGGDKPETTDPGEGRAGGGGDIPGKPKGGGWK